MRWSVLWRRNWRAGDRNYLLNTGFQWAEKKGWGCVFSLLVGHHQGKAWAEQSRAAAATITRADKGRKKERVGDEEEEEEEEKETRETSGKAHGSSPANGKNSLQKVYMNIVRHFLTVCQKQETNKLILYIFSCLSPQLIMLQTINLLQKWCLNHLMDSKKFTYFIDTASVRPEIA